MSIASVRDDRLRLRSSGDGSATDPITRRARPGVVDDAADRGDRIADDLADERGRSADGADDTAGDRSGQPG